MEKYILDLAQTQEYLHTNMRLGKKIQSLNGTRIKFLLIRFKFWPADTD